MRVHAHGVGTGCAAVPAPLDDGFVIALPYGTTSNQVKDVPASGTATLHRSRGVTDQ